jgi:hypothetical protein
MIQGASLYLKRARTADAYSEALAAPDTQQRMEPRTPHRVTMV